MPLQVAQQPKAAVVNSPALKAATQQQPEHSNWSPVKKGRTFDELQQLYY